ncbi:MAG: SPFH domain-containing protein [Gammaproteobacteria bacterium]
MTRAYAHLIAGIVVLAIVCVGLFLATYSVPPGQAVLLLHGGKVVAKDPTPGLHWKIPLLEHVVRLDARTRLSTGEVRPPPTGTVGLAVRYAVFWRVVRPVDFYHATNDDADTVNRRLQAVLSPVIQTAMTQGEPEDFLTVPSAPLEARLQAGVEPVSNKIGIQVLSVALGTAEIPPKLATRVADGMAAGTQREVAAAKNAGRQAREAIAEQARHKRERTLSDARGAAAKITGQSETKVAAIYAPLAKKAPKFFSYFLRLESESAALKSHTRLLIISMDSPWFKTLEKSAGKPDKR